MDNEKNAPYGEAEENKESEFPAESSSRARNRTVMLTPEITGEVRARLAKDLEGGPRGRGAPEPPSHGPSGHGAGGHGSSYAPAREMRPAPTQDQFVRPGALQSQPGHRREPPQQALTKEGTSWLKESPLVGFLVSYDVNPNGTTFELRSGRLIVTSEGVQGQGNYLFVNDGSVSPMHAIMRITDRGDIQVLDQLSEFGTRLIRAGSNDETELSGDKSALQHGDVIKFGNRSFHVCLISRG